MTSVLDKLFDRLDFEKQSCFNGVDYEDLIDSWRRPFLWALNLIFYLTHSTPEIEHIELNSELRALYRRREKALGKKRDKLAARIRELPSRSRIVVARSLTEDPRLPRTAQEARVLLKKTLVAGHWQRYHTGAGRANIEWRFRAPFWRGAGEEGSAVHEVR